MSSKPAVSARDMEVLSRVMFRGYAGDFSSPVADLHPLAGELQYVAALDGLRAG